MANMRLGVATFDTSKTSDLQHLRVTHVQRLRLTSNTSDSPTSNTSDSPPTPPKIMSNRERKIEVQEKHKAERKERHEEIKYIKKADKTAEEYSLASQQTGRVGASFSLIHRHQDARHAQ